VAVEVAMRLAMRLARERLELVKRHRAHAASLCFEMRMRDPADPCRIVHEGIMLFIMSMNTSGHLIQRQFYLDQTGGGVQDGVLLGVVPAVDAREAIGSYLPNPLVQACGDADGKGIFWV
jgi:hypothetical protein